MIRTEIGKKYLVVIVIFFVFYCMFLSWSFLFQNVDDAYISFRYGKNLMNGYGLVYNNGEYVEGYTNFLWTVIIAPFTKIKFADVSTFALILGLIISIYNIFLIIKINKIFERRYQSMTVLLLLLPAVFFVLDDSIAFWAIGGMEFPIYTMFILLSIYYYFKINENKNNDVKLALCLMFVTLNRPEGNMIFALTMFHFLFFRKDVVDFKKKLIRILSIYAAFFLVYYGFKYFYYGSVIPNTFYAKGVMDFSMNLVLGTKYLILCIGARFYIFIFLVFIPVRNAFKDFKESYLLLFLFIYLAYLLIIGGDWMIANRFFVPILPVIYILSTIGFSYELKKVKGLYSEKFVKATIVVICVILFGITLGFLEYNKLIIKDENYKYELQWSKFGQWLKKNVHPNTVIASGPAGKIPYYSELYTIDMWGLNNDFISKTSSKRLQSGHKKFDFEYVLSLKPEFIIGYAGFSDKDIPPIYEKFNAPEEKYKSIDVVFRLKEKYRIKY